MNTPSVLYQAFLHFKFYFYYIIHPYSLYYIALLVFLKIQVYFSNLAQICKGYIKFTSNFVQKKQTLKWIIAITAEVAAAMKKLPLQGHKLPIKTA